MSERLGITHGSASTLAKSFEDIGILKEIAGFKRNRLFLFVEYLNLFQEPNKPTIMSETGLKLPAEFAVFNNNNELLSPPGIKSLIRVESVMTCVEHVETISRAISSQRFSSTPSI